MATIILEELTKRAAEYFKNANDNKMFVSEEEMKLLLMAPASVHHLINVQQDGGSYITEVVFSAMCFVTVTHEPINFGSVCA